MKKLLWGLLVIVLICVTALCFRQSQKRNESTSDIDLLVEAYKSAKSTTDPDTKRRSINMISGCLMNISEAYQESDKREQLSDYLTNNIPRRIIEDIYSFLLQYNEENPDHSVQIPDDVIEFYD